MGTPPLRPSPLTPTAWSQTYKDDEDKKEQECQRTGATADFWTSFGEAAAYAIVYFLPGQWSRYVLVIIAVASTMIVAFISATYRQADLLHDVEGEADVRADGTSSVDTRKASDSGKRKTSMIRVSNAAEGESLLNDETPSCRDQVRYYCNCSCRPGSPMRDLFKCVVVAQGSVLCGLCAARMSLSRVSAARVCCVRACVGVWGVCG